MKPTPRRLAGTGLLAMVATIGFDLFLHGGVLAPLYSSGSPFLLPPEEAFRRIPLGYLSFALLVGFLVWLMSRLGIRGWRHGLGFGLVFGLVIWGSLTLGLYSISTASPLLLLGWFAGQSVEMGIAGMIIGDGLEAERLRPLLVKVAAFFILAIVLTVLIQNFSSFSE